VYKFYFKNRLVGKGLSLLNNRNFSIVDSEGVAAVGAKKEG
jgi:hypothetical protein